MNPVAGTETTVSILCRFWPEDGVWNGVAEDAAVAAFGKTFEEALTNLREAIKCHLESAIETGDISQLVERLRERSRDYGFLSPDQIAPGSPIVRVLVTLKDRELLAVT